MISGKDFLRYPTSANKRYDKDRAGILNNNEHRLI